MQNRIVSVFVAAALATFFASCSDSTTIPPAPVNNTPPTIVSVATASDRVEADRPLQVSAVVSDPESPVASLRYAWTATPQPGAFAPVTSFDGSQALNTWRPPKGQKTPDLYTVLVTVTESYTSAGQAKLNTVSKSTTAHYNDSPMENADLGYDFLVKKFGNYTVSPEEAVSNFSDSCAGKEQELSDIENNRANFMILSAAFPSPTVTLNTALTEGVVEGACTFEDIPKSGPNAGKREFVNGTCLLTTIYESANFRWRLCTSNFLPPYNTVPANLRGRVPGQIMRR
jgi:hypothetical protein